MEDLGQKGENFRAGGSRTLWRGESKAITTRLKPQSGQQQPV
jgi:hypothetical protein